MEHKTEMSFTKIKKQKKFNSTSQMEHKTEQN